MTSKRRLINGALLALLCPLPAAVRAQAEARAAESADGRPDVAAGSGQDALARSIVAKADEARLPREPFQVEVQVETVSGGETLEPRHYRVLSRGNDNTIVITLGPAVERGQNLLMKGRELWLFMPSVSQPVRLSLSQRLTGQVANGDLARANFSGDYEPRLVGQERIGGRDHHVLELQAAQRGVTYPKVMYWVRADNFHPHKADFYSLSGRLLKTCHYEKFEPMGGRPRPTRLVMTDALKPGDRSVLEYSAMKLVDLPERVFTKDYMKKLD